MVLAINSPLFRDFNTFAPVMHCYFFTIIRGADSAGDVFTGLLGVLEVGGLILAGAGTGVKLLCCVAKVFLESFAFGLVLKC